MHEIDMQNKYENNSCRKHDKKVYFNTNIEDSANYVNATLNAGT